MQFLKFRVDTDELIALHADVAKTLGGKAIGQPTQIDESPKTTNLNSKLLYGYSVPDNFLDSNIRWVDKVEK